MSKRDRLEAKLEKREEWARSREAKAENLEKQNEPFVRDHAFNTQPGHIPERARVIRRDAKAYEHRNTAQHHETKAAGLRRQLDRSIFSDDEDAVEKLEKRIEAYELQRERIKAINRAWKKVPGETWQAKLEAIRETMSLSENEYRSIARNFQCSPGGTDRPFPSYVLSNLGGRIQATKKRIAKIRRREELAGDAELAGGVAIRSSSEHDYCSITFAEKPERSVRTELKAAGFRWSNGSWSGRADSIPPSVREMAKTR